VGRFDISERDQHIWESILNTIYQKTRRSFVSVLRPGLTAIVLVAMLAWAGHSLARLFWLFTSPPSSAVTETVLPIAAPQARNRGQSDAVDIAYLQENFRLSNGRSTAATGSGGEQSQQAANTRLNLVLRGSIAGISAADSSAIIAAGDQQWVYGVGDELQFTTPGVILDSVHPQYVVLNNNGRLESLWMYEPQPAISAPVARVRGAQDAASPAREVTAARSNERVQIRVYRENGEIRGLQIRDDSDPGLLAAAGLQAGDIITAVDGVAVNQTNDLSALTRDLESRDKVSLELLRNNSMMTVTVSRDAFAF
jgi:general secretion pathway protein C